MVYSVISVVCLAVIACGGYLDYRNYQTARAEKRRSIGADEA